MQSQLENLQRRSGITKDSCYQAARRLNKHDSLSLFSLTSLAFTLIVISLVTQLYAENNFIIKNEKVLDISMTAASIFAMIISLVVQKSNFSLRADSYQRQAREINELRISFRHLVAQDSEGNSGQDKKSLYEEKTKEYSSILERHLLHDEIDYHIANTKGVENKYHIAKLIITEYFGYLSIIFVSLYFLFWICLGVYQAST